MNWIFHKVFDTCLYTYNFFETNDKIKAAFVYRRQSYLFNWIIGIGFLCFFHGMENIESASMLHSACPFLCCCCFYVLWIKQKYYRRAIFGYWMKQGDSSIADLEWELVNLRKQSLNWHWFVAKEEIRVLSCINRICWQ